MSKNNDDFSLEDFSLPEPEDNDSSEALPDLDMELPDYDGDDLSGDDNDKPSDDFSLDDFSLDEPLEVDEHDVAGEEEGLDHEVEPDREEYNDYDDYDGYDGESYDTEDTESELDDTEDEEEEEDYPTQYGKGDDLGDIFDNIESDGYDDDYTRGGSVSNALGDNGSIDIDDDFGDFDDDETGLEYLAGEGDEDENYFESLRGDTRNGLDIDGILGKAIELKASDVHINSDGYVDFTILGEITHMTDFGIIPANVVQRCYSTITSHTSQATFAENLELDTSYVIKKGENKGRRFRLSVGRSMTNVFMVFRVISDVIPSPKELGVPPSLEKWVQLPNGLVLICGPTGTGKSTTFASLVNEINQQQTKKIITVERPVEYLYPHDGKGLVTQREVGRDARSFSNALTSAMRQAPDVIMIGEVRDREEVDSLLRASESGHLAFSTMHTNTPPGTINRIKSLYEGDEQLRVLSSLKDNVRGIANQVLLKTKDGRGRFAVHCVLNVTPEVSEMIGVGDVGAIQRYMEENEQTMEHELVKAVLAKKCDAETARSYCIFPDIFDKILAEKLRK